MISLARTPTPLEHLEHASSRLGAEIWVKRDDLTGFGLSGNKVRKLEYLLADAVEKGHDAVVTCGGIQSNHCRATAIAARSCGEAVINSGRKVSYIPPGDLKSGIPAAQLTPAPVRTTTR